MSVRFRTRNDGSPYWQVRFRENGRECSVSWETEAEARSYDDLVKQVGPARAREICKIAAAPLRGITLRAWLEKHNDSLTGVEQGTLRTYRAYVKNDIGPALGDIPLHALSRDDLANWINTLAANGVSGKTIKNKRDYLSGALKAAVKAGEITKNPAEDVRPPRWDRGEMCFLTRDEFKLLLTEIPPYWQPLVEFLAASGCRWSEATALKPAAVDLAHGTVRITKAWKSVPGGWVLGVPKTKKSVRTIDVAVSTLKKLDYSGEWLFTNSGKDNRAEANSSGPVRLPSFHANVWRPAVKRATCGHKNQGFGKANCKLCGADLRHRSPDDPVLAKRPRLHDLRHTCASWLIQAGIPLPVIQAHLGHESITTTVGIYGHLDRASGKAAAKVLGGIINDDDNAAGIADIFA